MQTNDEERATTVEAGKKLRERLEGMLKDCEESRCCAIGINNYLRDPLRDPKYYCDTGKPVIEPPSEVPSNQGAPSLFSKSKMAPKGSAGVLRYDIGGNHFLYVCWSVPFAEVAMDNYFAIECGERREGEEEVDKKTWQRVYSKAKKAKDGEISFDYFGIQVTGFMEDKGTCCLVVDLHPK
eukprot:TRINITY_DN8625_c0_g1_i1.p2 TRINITY_DN8625_c0_g1~~TRINITY_DN8625_c0_g1_i1.p2  ORF type:complete len:181 (-),score=64.17 TRINITY_DN8625_c0_g1_i1:70-612(-)